MSDTTDADDHGAAERERLVEWCATRLLRIGDVLTADPAYGVLSVHLAPTLRMASALVALVEGRDASTQAAREHLLAMPEPPPQRGQPVITAAALRGCAAFVQIVWGEVRPSCVSDDDTFMVLQAACDRIEADDVIQWVLGRSRR